MKRRAVLGAGLAAPLLSGCGAGADRWTLRFRLKVSLVADGEIHEGASVFKAIYTHNPKALLGDMQSEFTTRVWGEAVAINLGARGYLFGLLGSVSGVEGPYFDPGREYSLTQLLPLNQQTPENMSSGRVYDILGELREELRVPPQHWPTFVRFTDIADKSTARLVVPEGQRYQFPPTTPHQSLESLGGADARIAGVAIEMTQDDVTHGIEQLLPWVGSVQGAGPGYIDHRADAALHENLDYRNFKMEGYSR